MKVIGRKIKPMVLENTGILMVQSTKANGEKINNMASVKKNGQMVPNSKEIILMVKSKEKESLLGLTEALIKVTLKITILKEEVFTAGQMVEFIMVLG